MKLENSKIIPISLLDNQIASYLATDWMTFEDVSLMLVRKRSVPPRRISRSPLPV